MVVRLVSMDLSYEGNLLPNLVGESNFDSWTLLELLELDNRQFDPQHSVDVALCLLLVNLCLDLSIGGFDDLDTTDKLPHLISSYKVSLALHVGIDDLVLLLFKPVPLGEFVDVYLPLDVKLGLFELLSIDSSPVSSDHILLRATKDLLIGLNVRIEVDSLL